MAKEERREDLLKRFSSEIKGFKEEQKKLSKAIIEKDQMKIEQIQFLSGVDVTTAGKKIIGSIIVTDESGEVVDQAYSIKNFGFPYISGFTAYRGLPAMIEAYKKVETKPDVIFISGHGVSHPRGCGIASHFGLATDTITIGVAKDRMEGEIKKDKLYVKGKLKGRLVETKKGSKPIIVSVGHKISLGTAVKLVKKFTKPPHKHPEALTAAHKFSNRIKNEIKE